MTRPDAWEHVRLRQWHFDKLWITWGGFDMDLMASTTSAERPPPPTSARVVIIVPDKSTLVPSAEERLGPNQNGRANSNVFCRVHHCRGTIPVVF